MNRNINQGYIETIINIIVILIFIIFAIKPIFLDTTYKYALNKEYYEISTDLDTKINILKKSQDDQNKYKENTDKIKLAIPDEKYDGILLKHLYLKAAKNNISFANIAFNISESEKNPNLKILGFTSTLTGNYESIMEYIEEITNFERIIIIKLLSLSNENSDLGVVKISISGEAYYYD